MEDVLGREQIEVDVRAVASYLEGQTVLVTGAGGSIGSELCRQIRRHGQPARIVLLDDAETPLFEIERELVDERDFTAALPVLADVGNETKLRQVFERFRPTVVFHAAAYKHVPLMEANPLEAVRNNALGDAHDRRRRRRVPGRALRPDLHGQGRQPETVMGAVKRSAEWIVAGARPSRRRRDALRGGALRQRARLAGSVIPIFRSRSSAAGRSR